MPAGCGVRVTAKYLVELAMQRYVSQREMILHWRAV